MRLQTTRRHVPLEHADEYRAAWLAVQQAVLAAGGRAWLFRGTHEDQFLEFIEWSDRAVALPEEPAVSTAVTQLDTFAPPRRVEEWEEVR